MGEYYRLNYGGYGNFWEVYGEKIEEIDKNLCTPVLESLGVETRRICKWPWDANGYYVRVKGKEFYFDFDVPNAGELLQLRVYGVYQPCRSFSDESAIGVIKVSFPRKHWGSLRRKLRRLLVSGS